MPVRPRRRADPHRRVHFAAWKETFDTYLRQVAAEQGAEFVPFDQRDYDRYVDGRPPDGTRGFLGSAASTCPRAAPTARRPPSTG